MAEHGFLDISTTPTMFDALAIIAGRHPDKDCIVVPAMPGRDYASEKLVWSYGQVLDMAKRQRDVYAAAGYGHGHRIAMTFDNRPSFVVHWLAMNALGISIVPINQDSTEGEITTLLSRSHSVLVIGLPHRMALIESAVAKMECPIPFAGGEWAERLPAAISSPLATPPGPATETGLLFTSGTTGVSKGAILTNESVMFNGHRYLRAGGLMDMKYGEERLYNPLPLTYANAFAHTNIAMILSAGCMIFPDRFHPKSWWQDMASTDATIVHHLGIIVPLMLQTPPSPEDRAHRVKFGLGASVSADQHAAWQERFGFPLIEVYGMTELGICSFASREPRDLGKQYVGEPSEGVEFRISDGHDEEAPVGDPGEVLVRRKGPDPKKGFFAGYLDNPELNAHIWRNGWYHTGDILKKDEAGRYYFVDRLKHMIRRSGQNISATEVENSVRAHPAVSEVACVPAADPLRQEEVVACIVLAPEAEATRETAESIAKWSSERVAYFKAPGGIVFMDKLPTTPSSHKLQKFRIFEDGEDVFARNDCFDLRHLKQRKVQANA